MSVPRAKKRLGQNFLVDETFARRVVGALAPRAGGTVLEIGPGRGALTSLLVESGARVVAVEFDRELAPLLRERFAGRANFTLVEADALEVDFCSAVEPAARARVVARARRGVGRRVVRARSREC